MPSLTFESEIDRKNHPVAGLIPLLIWRDFFGRELSDIEQEMMASPDSARALLMSEQYYQLSVPLKERCLLALLFAHPNEGSLFNGLNQEPIFLELVRRDDYSVFGISAGYGHLLVMNRLIELAPAKLDAMVEARNYSAFSDAAKNGHLPVMNRLIELLSDKVDAMVADYEYAAFRDAARNGHLPVMNRLIELAPDKVDAMVAADDYAAFRSAAGSGHLLVMNRLIELAPDKVGNMVVACNYSAFRDAANSGHLPTINRLMEFSSVFSHAEMHQQEYGAQYVQPFVQATLTRLREEKAAFEQAHPNEVFDVASASDASLYFYMIRNLIRQNNANVLDDMRFLLNIPAVKALAHTAVTPNEPNELLRLALTLGNQASAEVLLNIPDIRALAEQNNYYQAERRGNMDLRALAQDRESSMKALSTDEKRRLKRAIEHYQPLMKAAGVSIIITDLRETLASRYEAQPALLTLDNQNTIALPMEWGAFKALALNPEEQERALKAYYSHKDHTAWRYLSKPNPWMASNASYVYVNPDNHEERWSTFEEYLPLIAMLYLAAGDQQTPPTEGMTVSYRLDHFIDELAHIGRAHNWDDKRERTDAMGRVIEEEYDNLQGDKPSCYSGVNRRLFQSVMWHPLLTFLTKNGVKEELRAFMREHFTQAITADNRDALGDAWAKFCETSICLPCWDALNVPPMKQEAFLNHLASQYQTEFTDYPAYIRYVKDAFLLTPVYPAHVVRFAGETGLNDLLPSKRVETAVEERPMAAKETTPMALRVQEMNIRLVTLGALGVSMSRELDCLVQGTKSTWAIWAGASDKLAAMVDALNHLLTLTDDTLRAALKNQDSALCKALNQKPTADKTFRVEIAEALGKQNGPGLQGKATMG